MISKISVEKKQIGILGHPKNQLELLAVMLRDLIGLVVNPHHNKMMKA